MQELTLSTRNAQTSFARLGYSHGYRIDGDSALLNAEIDLTPEAKEASALALQLWACKEPHRGGPVSGFKVAEARVALAGAQASFWHEAAAFARPPAVLGDYAMVLVLAREEENRAVLDFANYPQRQRFVVPRFEGEVRCERAVDGSVKLEVERVFNPRPSDNLSGSLSVQLWSTREPYAGGELKGSLLASLALAPLAGQAWVQPDQVRYASETPSAREPHLTLALCEWTAEGAVVRDFRNFGEAPAVMAAVKAVVATPVVAVADAAPKAVAPKLVETPKVLETPKVEAVKLAEAPKVVETAKLAEASAVAAPKVAAATKAPAAVAAAPAARPSLNRVDEATLAELAGIQKKLAKDIIKARPFANFDDVLRVRGVGEKIVSKLRGLFTL